MSYNSFHEISGIPSNALQEKTPAQLVSVMDHSHGQRQFASLEKYREYYQGKYKLSETEMEAFVARHTESSRQYSDQFREDTCRICNHLGIPLACHDDATLEHVDESHNFNRVVAEFPTTAVAAKAAHDKGMAVMMGAPNVVRGGSSPGIKRTLFGVLWQMNISILNRSGRMLSGRFKWLK